MKKFSESTKLLLGIYLSSLLLIALVFIFVFLEFFFWRNTDSLSPVLNSFDTVNIVIDAGHGGRDGGASVSGVFEKDLNLQISNKISDFLKIYNVNVHMTREEDSLLCSESAKNKKREDLLNRVKFTNQLQDPIFVSIHMNKFSDPQYGGLQVFFSSNDPYSEALALTLQANNKKLLDSSNTRNVKKATSAIYVLDRLNCPAVLIECGFLSNKNDLENLCNEEYQNKLAFLIASSIIEYINL